MRLTSFIVALVGAVVGIAASSAQADRYEATVSGALSGGLARVGQTGADPVIVPTLGGSFRAAHAWRNTLAWDLQLAGGVTLPATFKGVSTTLEGRPAHGDVTRRTVTGAVQLGAELRLGSRYTRTVRLALGPQVRHRAGTAIGPLDRLPAETAVDALASLSLGLDFRLGAHLLVGVAVEAAHAQPLTGTGSLDVFGLTIRVSRAWYPRLWGPSW